MLRPYFFLSVLLLIFLSACGPPSSTDPSAKDQKLVIYDYEKAEQLTEEQAEQLVDRMTALEARLDTLRMAVAAIPTDYPSVVSGTTSKTKQRAGGTERTQNLPERGANVDSDFDSITSYNRKLLGGARELGDEADDYYAEANLLINAARAKFVLAKAENDWTDEEAAEWETPIIRAESALEATLTLNDKFKASLPNL